MPEQSTLEELSLIDLSIVHRLRDPEFRREWFRAELEASVPETFKALRERRGMTQGDLAAAIGTKQPAISRFEKSSDAVWEFANLLRMAEAMDARLRVVVDAAEDVFAEYEDAQPEGSGGSSVLNRVANSPLTQRNQSSVLDAPPIRKERYGIDQRGEQSARSLDDRDATKSGSALSA